MIMKINEVEKILEIPKASIRFYEKEGLLTPRRTDNKYRDYSDEDLEPFDEAEILERVGRAARELHQLAATYRRGRQLSEGVPCAIVGRPNSGKSSLLNALLGYDRAIVTDIPGTTRDTIEEKLLLGGVMLRLADTAGLRRTGDTVEQLGVERAMAAARQAELVLAVFDGSAPLAEGDEQVIAAAAEARRAIAVVNKQDLGCALTQEDEARLAAAFAAVCSVSAREGEGLEALGEAVEELFRDNAPAPAGEMITNERQAEALRVALDACCEAANSLAAGYTPDAVLTDVEAAMSAIGEITGRTVREDITARIFERFCVGK